MIHIEEEHNGIYQFVLKNATGFALFKSTPFPSQEAAQHTLTQLSSAHRFERQTDHRGNFLFQLRSAHGERLGKSTTFYSEAGMENGIKNLRRYLVHWQHTIS